MRSIDDIPVYTIYREIPKHFSFTTSYWGHLRDEKLRNAFSSALKRVYKKYLPEKVYDIITSPNSGVRGLVYGISYKVTETENIFLTENYHIPFLDITHYLKKKPCYYQNKSIWTGELISDLVPPEDDEDIKNQILSVMYKTEKYYSPSRYSNEVYFRDIYINIGIELYNSHAQTLGELKKVNPGLYEYFIFLGIRARIITYDILINDKNKNQLKIALNSLNGNSRNN